MTRDGAELVGLSARLAHVIRQHDCHVVLRREHFDGADAVLADIEAAGFDIVERIPAEDRDAPVLHRFEVVPDAEDGGFFIRYPSLPGCMTQAESLYEIGPMAQDAYVVWTRACQDGGIEIPASDLGGTS